MTYVRLVTSHSREAFLNSTATRPTDLQMPDKGTSGNVMVRKLD